MKLPPKSINDFFKQRPAEARVLLIYGPDTGLVKERATAMAKLWAGDINDPFSVAVMVGDTIDNDPARLSDEANAQSLMGGDRLVWIKEAGNGITPPLKDYLKGSVNETTLIIIEGGDLKPKDALRKLCEDAPRAVAIPCYVEDERDIANLIRADLTGAGFKIAPDAVQFLAGVIKGDRARARMEIEKLALYAHGNDNITLEDAKASTGDMGSASLDDLVYSMTGGNRVLCLQSLGRLLAEDVDPIKILRSMQYHLHRMLQVRAALDEGVSMDQAIGALQPPLFFKQADQFRAHVMRHTHKNLRTNLLRLGDLESRTKQTGAKVDTLISQFILKIAA
jgi:DNA polymerase-3 subunit delta